MRTARAAVALLLLAVSAGARPADTCDSPAMHVQVLGSGGADLLPQRAQSGYVVWLGGKSRVLVDAGAGAALRFAEAGASAGDLDVVLFTHLHVDHTADFPTIVAAARRAQRLRPLPVYGPAGNRLAPSTVTFVRTLLDGTRGAFRDLGDVLSPMSRDGYKLEPRDLRDPALRKLGPRREETDRTISAYSNERFRADATAVAHGSYPALAWRIRSAQRTVVFTGDTSGEGEALENLALDADLLIADHAVPEGASGTARYDHMAPSVIGRIASQARVKRVVLTHRTRATLGHEDETLAAIRKSYDGPVFFADDLSCFAVTP